MVHIKKQNRLRIYAAKLLLHALFPAFREIRLGVHILGKETILVRHAQKIQHRGDHVQMGNQDGLRQILGEILVPGRNALPQFRYRFAQAFSVYFG